MTEIQAQDTKERVLRSAQILFASRGFEGTSVRDIASEAGVNIAAVNYHFASKAKLFNHVIKLVFTETSKYIRARRFECPDEKVEDLAVWLFGYFLDQSDVLRSVFQILISENGWGPETDCGGETEKFGPPGGYALAEAIEHELQHEVLEADMFWAVKIIFSNVVHMALMYSNHFCKMPAEDLLYHNRIVLEADIRRLAKVVMKDLQG